MTALDRLRDETLHKELRAEFRQLVTGVIVDPNFEFEVQDIEVYDRQSAYSSDIEYEVVLRVMTNNRSQLLGQATPFNVGGYRGYFSLFYSGWLTSYVAQTRDIDERFLVSVDAIQRSAINDGPFDRSISLEKAIESGILASDSELILKMEQYELDHLVLGGGAAIAGPLPGPIQTMEMLCERYEIDSILDIFCGSAAMSRVVIEQGGSDVYCLDLDCSGARQNLAADRDLVTLCEGDFFELPIPDRQFDIAVLDPYFDLIPEVIERRLADITEHADRILLTAGFPSDGYWIDQVEAKLASEVESVERINTGRTIQLLGHT